MPKCTDPFTKHSMAKITKTITETWYDNGGYTYTQNGVITYIKYNTGDVVYLDDDGKVWSIATHDGLSFTYDTPRMPRGD